MFVIFWGGATYKWLLILIATQNIHNVLVDSKTSSCEVYLVAPPVFCSRDFLTWFISLAVPFSFISNISLLALPNLFELKPIHLY